MQSGVQQPIAIEVRATHIVDLDAKCTNANAYVTKGVRSAKLIAAETDKPERE